MYTIHVDGTNETFVTSSSWGAYNSFFSPTFTADDSELMFDRNNEIHAVHLDGTGMRYVVNNWTTTSKSPSPSPSGTAVAYEAYCSSVEIWATPAQVATNPCEGRRITPTGSFPSRNPAWGPDDYIAYERVRGANVGSIALISTAPNSTPCLAGFSDYDRRNPNWLVEP